MSNKRLTLVERHLAGRFQPADGLERYRAKGYGLNSEILKVLYCLPYYDLTQTVHTFMRNSSLFNSFDLVELSRSAWRQRVMEQLAAVFGISGVTPTSDAEDSFRKVAFCISLVGYNASLATRLLVHIALYTESIKILGTAKHASFTERALRLQDIGCFCMTEIGHGSNVSGIETTATFDATRREFVLHSPSPSAAKFWVGALGKTANMAVVFAQLVVNGQEVGVHAFLVPIRDPATHQPFEGVVIGDCGAKHGLHGIDNGFALFQEYRVPYDSLLDRHGHLSDQGKYKSSIKNKEKRFAAMLTGLAGGRIGVVGLSESCMRKALTIAIRFAATERQADNPEQVLLDSELHRYTLVLHLARLFASRVGVQHIIREYKHFQIQLAKDPESKEVTEFHALLSVFKVLISNYGVEAMYQCREACGQHGYSAFSGFAQIFTDQEVNPTWEGDNHVLLQQTSKYIAKQYTTLMKGLAVTSTHFQFVNKLKSQFQPFDDENFHEPDHLLIFLEQRVIEAFKRALKHISESTAKHGNPNDAWNYAQVHHFEPLALAFGELTLARLLLTFAKKLRLEHVATGEALTKVACVYMLQAVANDSQSVFGLLRPGQLKYLFAALRSLSWEVGEVAVTLIDAVAIPEELLGSGLTQGINKYMELIESSPGCYELPEWTPLLKDIRTRF